MTNRKSNNSEPDKAQEQVADGHDDGDKANVVAHYMVLARKYRPQTFEDLIGQEAMVTTLRNAFATGRIAQAYMLTGVRGVGKTTTARILARALNYDTGEDSAGDGPTVDLPSQGVHCGAIMESRHPDVLEMDAASNTGVDNVREIIESSRYRPVTARYKVFIIDEVHMLSKGAFNALLKTLEEPPEHVKFIFATTEIRKVPVTVLSRCQRFDLRRVDAPALVRHFARIVEEEGSAADEEALGMIARAAEGSVRDGLSILDQAIAIGSGKVTSEHVKAMLGLADRGRILDLLSSLLGGDAKGALAQYEALYKDGAEPGQILIDLAEVAHFLARQKVVGEEPRSGTSSGDNQQRSAALAAKLSIPLISRAWQTLVKGCEEAGRAPDAFTAGEMVLIRLAYMAELPSPDDLLRKLSSYASENVSHQKANHTGRVGGETVALIAEEDERAGLSIADAERRGPIAPDQVATGGDTAGGPALTCFEDVVALAGAKRDIQLKLELEEKARLVSFKPGNIELCLTERAKPGLAGELSQKLGQWTGQRWLVVVSRDGGGQTIREQTEARQAAERQTVEQHHLIQSLYEHFPGAEIEDIRPISEPNDEDSQAS